MGTNSLWTVSKLTVQSGGSVTIPCHYHRRHKDFQKFWCKGKNWLTCLTMRPTNQGTRTGISFDNSPDELVTTMTMTNLRSSDSNRYWCAVKIRGSYTRTSLELTVTEGIPDLSVASNRVSGEEGGNVTVQCLYSDKFKDIDRKWCRSGNLHSCQTAQDIEPSLGAALQINDTNDGVYSVTLTGLKKTDAGWYWCMAGEVQVPVHISVDSRQLVTDANTRASTFTTAQSFTSANSSDVHNHNSIATPVPTISKSSHSTSIQTEKTTDQTSTASPKLFHSTTQSSSHPTTTEISNKDLFHTSDSKDLTFEPTTTYERRELIWPIALVCGSLLILMLSAISWKLWPWNKKAITREEATEITTDHANDRADLLGNEWTTNPSVVQFSTDSNTVVIT
ncbi:polymeric immunoglobulin receptor [Garra rufa]|uniref:polymeric immunoglobulin receptor n=1 Tax=Garra rufa TaxID=137080 RepID=UPI003CCEB713